MQNMFTKFGYSKQFLGVDWDEEANFLVVEL